MYRRAMTSTVYVVDDDPSVLAALTRLLATEGYEVRPYSSPAGFLAAHDPNTPGCAVFDVSMPALNGLELQGALKSAAGTVRPVIFITGHGDIPTSVRAMKEGAVDFLTKPIDEVALINAIETAIERDRSERQSQQEHDRFMACYRALTSREREVLSHVVAGRLNKQIAADLGVAEKTIKLHRGRVMSKMKVRSVADLVRISSRLGL